MMQRCIRLIRYIPIVGVMFLLPALLLAAIPQMPPAGYVSDFAHVLSVEQKNAIENKLILFNASTTSEIAIVIVKSLEGDYVEHYAEELFKAWQVGTKKRDNGVLLLVAIDDRTMRIEVGYGLEGALTDAVSSSIIRNDLTPAFKKNDYYGGLNSAVDSIIKVTLGEYVADDSDSNTDSNFSGLLSSLPTLLIVIGVLFQGLASIFARSKSWWAGGVLGGVFGALLTFFSFFGITLFIGGVTTLIFIIIGLILDYIVSSRYTSAVSSGSRIPWWVGGKGFGGGGFSSGSRSSFGGFGGGRSGGGGASGSW